MNFISFLDLNSWLYCTEFPEKFCFSYIGYRNIKIPKNTALP